jgi:hypothetical protein
MSAPVLNGGFAQWFTSVSVRTGSKVPVLVKNPRRQKSAFSLFGWQSRNPMQATKTLSVRPMLRKSQKKAFFSAEVAEFAEKLLCNK